MQQPTQHTVMNIFQHLELEVPAIYVITIWFTNYGSHCVGNNMQKGNCNNISVWGGTDQHIR